MEPKLRTFVPVIVRGHESEGVKFWGFGKTVYQDLLGVIADPDYGDITDPVSGRDITVEFKTAEETGKSFPSTTIRVKPDRTPITDDKNVLTRIMETQRDILDIYKELSYDELKQVLANYLDPEKKKNEKKATEADEEVDETPAPKVSMKDSPKVTVASNQSDINTQFDKLFADDK
jgi:hypothetical protein